MDYSKNSIRKVLSRLKDGKISERAAMKDLEHFPFHDIGCAKIDFHRPVRKGFPEVVFAPGKQDAHIARIASRIASGGGTLLITKAGPRLFRFLSRDIEGLCFNEMAGMIYLQKRKPPRKRGPVTIITAGTSDIPVAEEAAQTLELIGCRTAKIYDVGVAGLHRIVGNIPMIRKSKAIIVVAGMEGALASIIGGLAACPVIAVPTSVGYGASFAGLSPLLTMLNSCAPGVCVMNIDNGFGAGYFAGLITK